MATKKAKNRPAQLDIGKEIKSRRLKKKWTLQNLSDKLEGVSVQNLSDIERGNRNITITRLAAILEVFGAAIGIEDGVIREGYPPLTYNDL